LAAVNLAALAGIAAGERPDRVARRLGIAEDEVRRLAHDPEAAAALADIRSEEKERLHHKLLSRLDEATDILMDLARDPDSAAPARVAAVKLMFEAIGIHKGAPSPIRAADAAIETQEDLLILLGKIPVPLLEQALARLRASLDRDDGGDLEDE
jgi:hypothetical protein